MTDPISLQAHTYLHFLSHEVQSRLMRVQSLLFMIERLQHSTESQKTTATLSQRKDRLQLTLREISLLERITSQISLYLLGENFSAEQLAALQTTVFEWAALQDEYPKEFIQWIEELTGESKRAPRADY